LLNGTGFAINATRKRKGKNMKQIYTHKPRGYFRVLNLEQTTQQLKAISARFPMILSPERCAKILAAGVEGCWYIHHADKDTVEAFRSVCRSAGGQAPIVYPTDVGYYDVYVTVTNRRVADKVHETRFPNALFDDAEMIKAMAEELQLDVWDDLIGATPEVAKPLQYGGFLRVFDFATFIEYVKSDVRTSIKQAMDAMDAMEILAKQTERLGLKSEIHQVRFLQISNISLELLTHLKASLEILHDYQLDNGLFELWAYSKTDATEARVKILADALGLEVHRHDLGKPVLKFITFPKDQRVTASQALRLKEGLANTVEGYQSELSELANWPMVTRAQTEKCIALLPPLIEGASVTLWREDMWLAALSGAEAFTGYEVTKELVDRVYAQSAFWTVENYGHVMPLGLSIDLNLPTDSIAGGMFITGTELNEEGRDFVGRPIKIDRTGFTVILIFHPSEEDVKNSSNPRDMLPRLRILPPLFPGDKIPQYWATLIAALHFIELPIIAKERLQAPRHERRQAERERRKLSDVHVIYLRRLKKDHKHPDSDLNLTDEQREEKKREYSYQWMVQGHWRQQWYPSLQTHKPTYILPYFKGDASMPFKAPGKKVYKVAR
jgi:uncharacterized protein CbrC (UPF0167 family)